MPKNNSSAKANPKEPATESGPSGLEVGRLILRDLAKAYENMGQGLLTDRERLDLVENLRSPEEIRHFNQFRYLHEYLTRANLAFTAHRQAASACFWQIKYYLVLLERSAAGDRPGASRLPLKKSDRSRGQNLLFQDAEGVLISGAEAAPDIERRGKDTLRARPEDVALDFGEIFKNLTRALEEYRQAVREELVIEAAVEIISRFVEVPEIRGLVGWVDLEEFKSLNAALSRASASLLNDGYPVDTALKKALEPLNMDALAPSRAALRKADKAVDFTTVQGNIESFYNLLRS